MHDERATLWDQDKLFVQLRWSEDGGLVVAGQDLRAGGEYEYFLSVPPADVSLVAAALGCAPSDVLRAMAARGPEIVLEGEREWLQATGATVTFFSPSSDVDWGRLLAQPPLRAPQPPADDVAPPGQQPQAPADDPLDDLDLWTGPSDDPWPSDDSDDDEDEEWRIADRYSLAASWSIASQLVRCHPHLLISRVVDEQENPLLIVHDEAGLDFRVQLDLPAWIQYVDRDGELLHITWADVLTRRLPRSVVWRIEEETGLGTPMEATLTPRSLTYQVIGCALALGVDSTATWQAVPAQVVIDDPAASDWHLFDAVPGGRDLAERHITAAEERARADGMFIHHQQIWALIRDHAPVALLDIEGMALTATHRVDLSDALATGSGSVAAVTTQLLGEALD